MTIREMMIDRLILCLVWPKDAEQIMDIIEAENEPMRGRWNDAVEGYPDVLFGAVWLTVRQAAADWLKKTNPKHVAISVLSEVDDV